MTTSRQETTHEVDLQSTNGKTPPYKRWSIHFRLKGASVYYQADAEVEGAGFIAVFS